MADSNYKTFSYRFENKGLTARYLYDHLPPGSYQNLENLECRSENALSTRYGWQAISYLNDGSFQSLPLGAPVNSLTRMQAIGQSYRYAGAGGKLFRVTGDGPGAYSQIASGLSGGRMSMYPYRPDANANPYLFIADDNKLLKDSGNGNAVPWGIAPPIAPAQTQLGSPFWTFYDSFDANFAQTFSGFTGVTNPTRVSFFLSGAVSAPGLQTVFEQVNPVLNNGLVRTANVTAVTLQFPHGYNTGMKVSVNNPADTSFNSAGSVITVTGPQTFTYSNPGPTVTSGVVGPNAAKVSAAPSLMPGMFVLITGGIQEYALITSVVIGASSAGFTANFLAPHFGNPLISALNTSGSVAANTTATITRVQAENFNQLSGQVVIGPYPATAPLASDSDIVSIWFKVDNPQNLIEIKLAFDVGDGTYRDYYVKSISPATFQPAVSGALPHGQVMTRRIFDRAGARADNRRLGFAAENLDPSDLVDLRALRPFELNTGQAAWTHVEIIRGEFLKVGNAGNGLNTWANITGYQVTVKTAPNAGVTLGVDDLAFYGASGVDSFNGNPYDYRYTYYNINTGCESNPSMIQQSPNFITPRRQPVAVTFFQPSDPQVTHVRMYRRGGTLTQAWYLVAQVPAVTGGVPSIFTDTFSDANIEVNQQLQLNNDPPVTSVLPTPASTTISNIPASVHNQFVTVALPASASSLGFFMGQTVTIGNANNQEQAIVGGLLANGITMWLQNIHSIGEPVTASAKPQQTMHLMAIAFDTAWLAGDPNNPHVLYYSKPFRPETFPAANSIEVGTPDAPIMALVELRGLLYVFTTKRVYTVLGAGGGVPTVIPTGVKHGLAASFAWCASENVIYYLSYDGVYQFQGSGSPYLTEQTEWIWTGKNLGPVQAMDTTRRNDTIMTYGNHEVFVSYVDQNGNRHRMIWHEVYQRWRNDDSKVADVTAEFFEEDNGLLIIGGSDGMVYQDRTNDYDWGTVTPSSIFTPNPISFTLQTSQMDMDVPKAFKVFNELTLDMDTNGQPVNISLVFDNGSTVLPLIGPGAGGTFSQNGRGQVQININNGKGQRSQNVGLLITGSVTQVATFYEVHIRALVEAEFRQSFDSYWTKWGTDEWKIVKQGWFEYSCTQPITFNVFTEGNMTAPAFTFTLPASQTRTTERVRFPATKCTLSRWIATATADFQLYSESHIEQKPVCGPKGYQRQKLAA